MPDHLSQSETSNTMRYELYYAIDSERPFLAFASYSDAAGAALVAAQDGVEVEVYDLRADEIIARVRP